MIADPGFNSFAFSKDGKKGWKADGDVTFTTETDDPFRDRTRNRGSILKISDPGKAGISQQIHGLEPGRLYTLSAFVAIGDKVLDEQGEVMRLEGERRMELCAAMDGSMTVSSMYKSDTENRMVIHKFVGTYWQPLRLNFISDSSA